MGKLRLLTALIHHPPPGRALSAVLQLEPRPPGEKDGHRSILSQPYLQASRVGAGLEQTQCSSGMERSRMAWAPLNQQVSGERMGQGYGAGQGLGNDHKYKHGKTVGLGSGCRARGSPELKCPKQAEMRDTRHALFSWQHLSSASGLAALKCHCCQSAPTWPGSDCSPPPAHLCPAFVSAQLPTGTHLLHCPAVHIVILV